MRNKKFFFLLGVFFILLILSVPMYIIGNYYFYLDQFTQSLKHDDVESARINLTQIHKYYDMSNNFLVSWLTDRYLFKDAWYYEGLYNYQIGEYQKVQEDLDGKQDCRAQDLIGNSLFMIAKARFKAAEKNAEKKEVVKNVVEDVSPYYERALKMCTHKDEIEHFKYVWNYDLTSNEGSAGAALAQEGKQPLFVLGYPKEGNEGPGVKGKGEGEDDGIGNKLKRDEGKPPSKKVG